ncbi:MAG: extensin family protein [Janthinobacterium lividum]
MRIARLAWIAFVGVLIAGLVQWLLARHSLADEDLPWTRLDLSAPVGMSTGRKLALLAGDAPLCRALLREADVRFGVLPDRPQGPGCGWTGAVRLASPARPRVVLTCQLAAAFEVWMRQMVQPAAVELLGSRVTRVDDLGSFACRHIRGGTDAGWSEHASANAIDVAGFRLADGRRIMVAHDWARGPRGAFLHAVRDGGCRIFATILSPDYNVAHRDHLHLDEASRGELGWRACR